MARSSASSEAAFGDLAEICVIGTFQFRVGERVLPAEVGGSQRLLAFLALRDRPVMRATLSGTLWPGSSSAHAFSSLRSALARLSRINRDALIVTPLDLSLADGVVVDIRTSRALAHRLLDPGAELLASDLGADSIRALSDEVLPSWGDDWVMLEAEEWRQLRLHALEALAEQFLAVGRYGEAVGAAAAAVRIEPLRESARAAIMRVHLAEGNELEAARTFKDYRAFLQTELGLEPTARLGELLLTR